MKTPLVSILIINWNGEDILHSCLESIFNQKYKNIEVIVVDNNSFDNSIEIIKKFKKVKLIESKINLGFAGGNNLGYKSVRGDYVLLLNTDAIVTDNFLVKIVDLMQNESSIGIVQPKVFYTTENFNKKDVINSIGAFFMSTGFLYYPGYGKAGNLAKYNKKELIFSAFGACMLIRKKVLETTGFFDPDYFMYFEETDFCMRAGIAGWKLVYIPDAVIYHQGGVSTKKFGIEKIYFHSFKNRICTYLKNLEIGNLLKIMPLHLLTCEAISFAYLFTGKFAFALAIQKAIFWNITNIASTYRKRVLINKRIRKVRDSEYLPVVTRSPRLSYYLYLFKGLQYYKD